MSLSDCIHTATATAATTMSLTCFVGLAVLACRRFNSDKVRMGLLLEDFDTLAADIAARHSGMRGATPATGEPYHMPNMI